MKYNIVVATHHKTGTVWMDGVFKAIARDFDAQFINCRSQSPRSIAALRTPFVLFNYDSDFAWHPEILDRDDVRIMHLIRDPRDVLISAMHYHRKSTEAWLHEPIPGYDRITYQAALRALPTKLEKYVFELEHSTAGTIRDLLAWQYRRPNCFEARYEYLRQDTQLEYWRRITSFLGFRGADQAIVDRRFWQNSLFGGLPRLGNRHVRSGEVAQWKREFTRDLAYAFLKRFPNALQALGYEMNNAWVSKLQPANSQGVIAELKHLVGAHCEVFADLARHL
jgi:Sulfotransferase domain